jgi:hypothetical protein
MRQVLYALALSCILALPGQAAEFVLYPGATLDEAATKEAMEAAAAAKMTGVKTAIYTTSDAFAKVAKFYQGMGTEYAMPRASGVSGQPKKSAEYDLWEAYFILDGAKGLASSKRWVKVQRPYIGEAVQDVTAIVVTEKK